MQLTVIDRFYQKVEPNTSGELFRGLPCRLWIASCYPEGYGQFWDGERRILAHKWHWEHFNGPVPAHDTDGNRMVLDHECHNDSTCQGGSTCPHRRCVELAHLAVVTHKTNVMRGNSPSAKLARLGECSNGHPKTPDNLVLLKNGGTRCRECSKNYRNASAARKRAGL